MHRPAAVVEEQHLLFGASHFILAFSQLRCVVGGRRVGSPYRQTLVL